MVAVRYWAYKNAWSIDGLPGMAKGIETGARENVEPITKMVSLEIRLLSAIWLMTSPSDRSLGSGSSFWPTVVQAEQSAEISVEQAGFGQDPAEERGLDGDCGLCGGRNCRDVWTCVYGVTTREAESTGDVKVVLSMGYVFSEVLFSKGSDVFHPKHAPSSAPGVLPSRPSRDLVMKTSSSFLDSIHLQLSILDRLIAMPSKALSMNSFMQPPGEPSAEGIHLGLNEPVRLLRKDCYTPNKD